MSTAEVGDIDHRSSVPKKVHVTGILGHLTQTRWPMGEMSCRAGKGTCCQMDALEIKEIVRPGCQLDAPNTQRRRRVGEKRVSEG